MTEQPKVHRSIEADALAASGSASLEADGLDTAEQRMRQALGLRNSASPSAPRPADRASPAAKLRSPEAGVAHRRHRFVQDGEVPVVHVARRAETGGEPLASGTNRLQAAESQMQAERAGRERAERALQSAQGVLHELQTKLGHAELALGETQAQARSRAAEVEELRAAQAHLHSRLTAADEARRAAEEARRAAEETRRVAEDGRRSAEEAAQEALAALRQEIQAHKAADMSASRGTMRAARPEKAALVKSAAREPRTAKRAAAVKTREPQPVKWWLAAERAMRTPRKSRS